MVHAHLPRLGVTSKHVATAQMQRLAPLQQVYLVAPVHNEPDRLAGHERGLAPPPYGPPFGDTLPTPTQPSG